MGKPTKVRTELARAVEAFSRRNGVERTAAAIGVNRTTLYKWKIATELPDTVESIWRLADLTGRTIDDLVGRTAGPAPEPTVLQTARPEPPTPEPIVEPPPAPTIVMAASVGREATALRCEACGACVMFPESVPGHHLAAAIERFRRNHAACYRKGEGRGEAS